MKIRKVIFKSDSTIIRLPARYMRAFSLFNVCSSSKNCPPRFTAVTNAVFGNVDVFGTKMFLLIIFHNNTFLVTDR
jgi:hypothetical protein